ncbi:MAG: hypothetical protein ACRD82_09440, partial [Blastocatellia bacterium]
GDLRMANYPNNLITAMIFTPEEEERFLNPESGTAAARAREFGIDLTLTLACLRMTPQERVEQLEAKRDFVYEARKVIWKKADTYEEA